MDQNPLLLSQDDLNEAANEKRDILKQGALANNLSNRASFGNYFLGIMPRKVDAMGRAQQQAGMVDQDIKNRVLAQQQAMQAPELDYVKQMNDPNSMHSKLTKATAIGALKSIKAQNPEAGEQFDEAAKAISAPDATGMQVHQVMEKNPLIKEAFANSIAGQKLQAMAGMFAGRIKNQNDQKAQATVNGDKTVNTYVPRIDGAQKILNLMDGAERGDFKSNQAMLGQLNAEISRLETGSQAPGLHASEKTEMEDAAAKLHNVMDTISGDVTGVDLHKKFEQARGMVKDLGRSYYNQVNKRIDFLKAGASPEQAPIYENKRGEFQRNYGPSFGDESQSRNGSDGKFNDRDRAAMQEIKQILADPNASPEAKAKANHGLLILSGKAGQ